MEVIGGAASVITIVALFRNCLDAFDLIQAGKDMEAESFKLILRLQLEKSRLWAWGDAMALTVEMHPGQQHALELHPTRNLIAAALRTILALFTDADQLQKKYGCKQDHSSLVSANSQLVQIDDNAGTLLALNASFDDFRVPVEKKGSSKGLVLRTRWVLRDQAKFCKLIDEIKSFIDPLKDLTASISSVAAQNRNVTQRIQRINKPEALDLISEVCEIEYPEFSSAASQKLNLLSMANDRVHEVADWVDHIDDETDKGLEDILSLDLLELGERFKAAKEDAAEKARLLSEVSNDTKATELELKSQLNIYVEKFKQNADRIFLKQVEDTLNNSNELFLTFRREMEEMAKKTKRLELENARLRRKYDAVQFDGLRSETYSELTEPSKLGPESAGSSNSNNIGNVELTWNVPLIPKERGEKVADADDEEEADTDDETETQGNDDEAERNYSVSKPPDQRL